MRKQNFNKCYFPHATKAGHLESIMGHTLHVSVLKIIKRS